jgi:hypothetical protein
MVHKYDEVENKRRNTEDYILLQPEFLLLAEDGKTQYYF